MNRNGFAVIFLAMLSISIIIVAIALTPGLKQHFDSVRGNTTDTFQGLDCSNASISDYDKANCAIVDIGFPFWFFGVLALAGAVIGAKIAFGG